MGTKVNLVKAACYVFGYGCLVVHTLYDLPTTQAGYVALLGSSLLHLFGIVQHRKKE